MCQHLAWKMEWLNKGHSGQTKTSHAHICHMEVQYWRSRCAAYVKTYSHELIWNRFLAVKTLKTIQQWFILLFLTYSSSWHQRIRDVSYETGPKMPGQAETLRWIHLWQQCFSSQTLWTEKDKKKIQTVWAPCHIDNSLSNSFSVYVSHVTAACILLPFVCLKYFKSSFECMF